MIASFYSIVSIVNLARDVWFSTLTGYWYIVVKSFVIMPSSTIIHVGLLSSSLCLLYGAIKYSRNAIISFLNMAPIFITLLFLDLFCKLIEFTENANVICRNPIEKVERLERLVLMDEKVTCLPILGYLLCCLPGWIVCVTAVPFWFCAYKFSIDI